MPDTLSTRVVEPTSLNINTLNISNIHKLANHPRDAHIDSIIQMMILALPSPSKTRRRDLLQSIIIITTKEEKKMLTTEEKTMLDLSMNLSLDSQLIRKP